MQASGIANGMLQRHRGNRRLVTRTNQIHFCLRQCGLRIEEVGGCSTARTAECLHDPVSFVGAFDLYLCHIDHALRRDQFSVA